MGNRSLFLSSSFIRRDVYILRTTDSFNEGNHEAFLETLLDSAFTLCPGGTHQETFRIYEALEAGSIPIIKAGLDAFAPFDEPLEAFDPTGGLNRVRAQLHQLGDALGLAHVRDPAQPHVKGVRGRRAFAIYRRPQRRDLGVLVYVAR